MSDRINNSCIEDFTNSLQASLTSGDISREDFSKIIAASIPLVFNEAANMASSLGVSQLMIEKWTSGAVCPEEEFREIHVEKILSFIALNHCGA